MMNMGSLLLGSMGKTYLLEKVIIGYSSFSKFSSRLVGMTLVVKIYWAFSWWEELDSPPLANPSTMVLTTTHASIGVIVYLSNPMLEKETEDIEELKWVWLGSVYRAL